MPVSSWALSASVVVVPHASHRLWVPARLRSGRDSDAACRHGLIGDHTVFHVVASCRANPAMVAPSKRNCRIAPRTARRMSFAPEIASLSIIDVVTRNNSSPEDLRASLLHKNNITRLHLVRKLPQGVNVILLSAVFGIGLEHLCLQIFLMRIGSQVS